MRPVCPPTRIRNSSRKSSYSTHSAEATVLYRTFINRHTSSHFLKNSAPFSLEFDNTVTNRPGREVNRRTAQAANV